MTTSSTQKIIVIGGSGETGKRIVYHLSQTYPDLHISSAARRAQPNLLKADNVDAVVLDINAKAQALKLLAQYDLALITLGPMEKYAAQAHQLCLEAKLDCIDINDSLVAADSILALHDTAKTQERAMFTGMGLTPGLSTLLLMQLAHQNASPQGHYHCRSYMGAAYGGGETSPYAILASFTNKLSCFEDGKRMTKATPWQDEHKAFHFPGQKKPLPLIPYSAVETAGLAASHRPETPAINTFDCRYHIQFMGQGMARMLARFHGNKSVTEFFAKQFYKGGQSMKQKKKADPDTTLWVYPDGAPEQGLFIHGVISSYDLTALMACAVADCWLNGDLQTYKGVYGTEHLSAETHQKLVAALAKRGITSRKADLPALVEEGIHFGWVEPVCGDVTQLSNYSRNWYTADCHHPKMVPLQKQFLMNSAVWKALKKAHSTLGFIGFVIKFMNRWKAHNKRLTAAWQQDDKYLAEQWKHVTRDISMFTSGYSAARDVLGQEAAYKLYRQMFLETGRMEMRWLWPEPVVFAAFDSPATAVKNYWLAFMMHYAKLKVFTLSIIETEQRIVCDITDCAYAKMFIELGCPELENLVREMEREALEHLVKDSGWNVTWTQKEHGEATIVLQQASAVVFEAEEDNQTLYAA